MLKLDILMVTSDIICNATRLLGYLSILLISPLLDVYVYVFLFLYNIQTYVYILEQKNTSDFFEG